MNQHITLVRGLFFLWVFSTPIFAAPNIEAGKEKSGVCFNCHGQGGNSHNPNIPSLAGQKAAYLVNQLRAFREGGRKNGMMQNMTKHLSNQDINNLAAFFNSLKSMSIDQASTSAQKGGSKVSMCLGCHGMEAKGMGVTPRLAGQQPAYLKRQLLAFKEGTRKNGPMSGIAKMLSEEDLTPITEYLGHLK